MKQNHVTEREGEIEKGRERDVEIARRISKVRERERHRQLQRGRERY